jgi:hypothetical protein
MESYDDKSFKQVVKRKPLPLFLIGLAMVGYAVIVWQWL